ncbi:MAG: hypothetical protein E6K53_02930 [Gammaproteobacteria bacterium]|nr:MAG: hypothetical protein E6K53_02930 [Gammaproteobacteria bacterium]
MKRLDGAWRQREETCVGSIVAWLRALDHETVVWPQSWRLPFVRAQHAPLHSAQRNAQAYLSCLCMIQPFPLAQTLIVRPPAGIAVERVAADPVAPKVTEFTRDEALLSDLCAQVARTIHQVQREALDLVAGHESCIHAATEILDIHREIADPELCQDPALCPIGQGFYLWRCRAAAFQRDIEESLDTSWVQAYCTGALARLHRDLFSAFYNCITSIGLLQAFVHHGQELTNELLHTLRYGVNDAWMSLPNHDFSRREHTQPEYFYHVYLDDPGIFKLVRCDKGQALERHRHYARLVFERRPPGNEDKFVRNSCDA